MERSEKGGCHAGGRRGFAGGRSRMEFGFPHQQESLDQYLCLCSRILFRDHVCTLLLRSGCVELSEVDALLPRDRYELHYHLLGTMFHRLPIYGQRALFRCRASLPGFCTTPDVRSLLYCCLLDFPLHTLSSEDLLEGVTMR